MREYQAEQAKQIAYLGESQFSMHDERITTPGGEPSLGGIDFENQKTLHMQEAAEGTEGTRKGTK